ncbi:MAG TPA: oligosaccharide flippase family protein [Thermoanaerobaculia bacterium]
MSSTAANIAANLAGRFWSNILSIAVVPVYLSFLGAESYGLIGIFTTLHSVIALLDLGLIWVLMRELTRLSTSGDNSGEERDLMRTVEALYWVISIAAAAAVFLLAEPLASHWIRNEGLPHETVVTAVRWMAVGAGLQFPFFIYQAALMGLQRQVAINVVQAVTATVRAAGGVLLVWQKPDIVWFLAWQSGMFLLSTGIAAFYVWRKLPPSPRRPRFRIALVSASWRYALGTTLIAVVNAVLSQADKIVLSKMLTLKAFGYYTIAFSIATTLWSIARPLSSAVFPRLSQLLATGGDAAAAPLYHRSTQMMSVLLGPAALMMVFFSYQMVLVWTQSAVTAENTWVVAALGAASILGFGLGDIPYFTRIAAGWVQLSLVLHSCLIVVVVPALAWTAKHYGPTGSAAVWAVVGFASFLISVTVMHRRMLRGELARFLLRDTAAPLLVAATVGLIGHFLVPRDGASWLLVLSVGTVYALMVIGAIAVAPDVRSAAMQRLQFAYNTHVRNRARTQR